MMVDEVTTWLLGNCWGGGIRNFENSKNRHFEDSRIHGLVGLVTCGLFKIGVLLYLGGVICKKSSLFS